MPKDRNSYDLHPLNTRSSQCEQTTGRGGKGSRRRLRRSGPPSEKLNGQLSTDDTLGVKSRTRVALLGRGGLCKGQPSSCLYGGGWSDFHR